MAQYYGSQQSLKANLFLMQEGLGFTMTYIPTLVMPIFGMILLNSFTCAKQRLANLSLPKEK